MEKSVKTNRLFGEKRENWSTFSGCEPKSQSPIQKSYLSDELFNNKKRKKTNCCILFIKEKKKMKSKEVGVQLQPLGKINLHIIFYA